MKEVRFEYKCRRCGKVVDNMGTGANPTRNVQALLGAIAGPPLPSTEVLVTMFDLHNCDDDGIGISDLIGCSEPQ